MPPIPSPEREITALLQAWSRGDQSAPDALLSAVYGELRRQAKRYMRQQPVGHTLQATALVHEAYLRLIDQRETEWQSRAHFFGVAAKAMRSILVDHARGRKAAKRGAGAARLTLGHVERAHGSKELRSTCSTWTRRCERLGELDPEKARLSGVAVLWRLEHRGGGRSARRLSGDGQAAMEPPPGRGCGES